MGTASAPDPTSPRASSSPAPGPASGRRATAASAAERMSVRPAWCSVAAVVRMMKYITRFEKNMPVVTSQPAQVSSASPAPGRRRPPLPAFLSSASWLACQKKRYGEIVVPSRATRVARKAPSSRTDGTKVPRRTSAQSGRAKKAAPM
jgi:hypothetical protein